MSLLIVVSLSLTLLSCGSSVEREPIVSPPEADVPVSVSEPVSTEAPTVMPPPMLDGLIGKEEWTEAHRYDAGWGDGRVWIRPDSPHVFICVASTDTTHTGMDLYLKNMAGEVFMLHTSYAHAHRYLDDSAWQELKWGPSGQWTSNLIQSIIRNGQRVYLAPDAFEFQISRNLLPTGKFRFMLHLERPERWIPKTADTMSVDNWLWYIGQKGAGS